jgi:hypothetical protein
MLQDLTKNYVKKLKDMKIMRIYKEETTKITTSSEQQNNKNEETSEIYFAPCIVI